MIDGKPVTGFFGITGEAGLEEHVSFPSESDDVEFGTQFGTMSNIVRLGFDPALREFREFKFWEFMRSSGLVPRCVRVVESTYGCHEILREARRSAERQTLYADGGVSLFEYWNSFIQMGVYKRI